MLGSTTGKARESAALACCVALAAAALACAASTATQPQSQAGTMTDVRVDHEGDATIVTLVGLEHPVFTAFEQKDPERVVVDLASVQADPDSDEIAVDDGLVGSVAWSRFGTGVGDPMTRIEITLTERVRYDVTPTDAGLEIWLSPGGEGLASADDPWAIEPLGMEGEDDLAEGEMEAYEPVGGVLAPAAASALLGLEAKAIGSGALVTLRADGMLDAESFTLADPDRLVIDLPGVTNQLAQKNWKVGSPQVQAVRVGVHADRVRVVIDAGSAENPFDKRRMVPTASGLLVALGSGAEIDGAVAAAMGDPAPMGATAMGEIEEVEDSEVASPEIVAADEGADEAWDEVAPLGGAMDDTAKPAARVAAPSGVVTIYGIEYDAQAEYDRVVVMGENPFDYLIYEPDGDTVVLSIEKAVIDPGVTGRIAPEPGGPVSLITAFAQPDVATSEVRVVVKRAANLKPLVSRKGSLLIMDFPRTGGVAATPPVLADLPGMTPAAPSAAPAAPSSKPLSASPQATAEVAVTPAAAQAPSQATPASLEPPAAIGILEEGGLFDGKEYTGRRISLDFKDVEISDVLRLIAEVSDLNVIAGDEVSGRVTIRLVDVPWDQALDVILLTKTLGFMRVGNVLRIAPAEVIKQEEEARLQERRAKEQLEDLVVKLQPINYASVKDVEKMVKKLLSARGSVNIDIRTNTLILKDIPSVIDEATALVKAIDTQTPQVMIEAKIVEASLDFSRELGSQWGLGSNPELSGGDFDEDFTVGGKTPNTIKTGNFPFETPNNAVFSNPITTAATGLMNLGSFILDDKFNVSLQLRAAEVNGDGKVISSPRVVTLDNKKAEIKQGVSIPFQTFENGDAQLEFVDAVLRLNVTPHITADKSIIMKIEVSRNAPDDSVFTATGTPAIAKNEVETETLVKDGQTLVLGGIYVVDKSNRQSRVPYLHRIPLLGIAFRSDEVSDSRKELLIFVTPHIVLTPQQAS